MSKIRAFSSRTSYLAIAASLLATLLLSALVVPKAKAAQITNRSITLSSSVAGATSTTYSVSFRPATASAAGVDVTDIEGIVVEFCENSPLIGAACTAPTGMTGIPTTSTINVAHTGSPGTPVAFNVHANSQTTNLLILTHATGLSTVTTSNAITFSFTATNTSDVGTFYARILTYNDETVADDYDDQTPGTHLDDGAVALSTARQLTVNARVQEQLTFCVGSVPSTVVSNATTPADCSDAAFGGTNQTVDIGVVDSTAARISPVTTANGGNDRNGAAMIATNAANGATISYLAEPDNSSGQLKVPSVACSGTSSTDQCFNSAGATQTSFAAAGERFGMTISDVYRPTGSTTTNLTRGGEYDGDGTAATGFAWVDNAVTQIASSTTVLDYEMLLLRFAARAAATTPTGAYSVTTTFIATSTF